MLSRIEKQLKRRFAIGSQVSEHSIIQDFTKQVGLLGAWVEVEEGAGGVLVAALPLSNQCLVAQQTGCGAAVPHLRPVPSSLGTASVSGRGTFPIPLQGGDRFSWNHTQASPSPSHLPLPPIACLLWGGEGTARRVSFPLTGDSALDSIERSWPSGCYGELVIFKISGTILVSGLGSPFMYI